MLQNGIYRTKQTRRNSTIFRTTCAPVPLHAPRMASSSALCILAYGLCGVTNVTTTTFRGLVIGVTLEAQTT